MIIYSDAVPGAVQAAAEDAEAAAAEAVRIDSEFSVSVAYYKSVQSAVFTLLSDGLCTGFET